MRERAATGVTLAQVGRELGVRPDRLRKWARTFPAPRGGVTVGTFATRLARYGARNPVALERLTYDRAAKAVTYRSDKS